MAINKKDYSLYGPFKLWTIENFPFIEADFDAITNYQLYSKIVEQMRKLCENQTKLQVSQNELIDAFNNLEKYVDDYFADLDIQTEIDNKLDEMAESGQLTDIIAQYLGLAGVLAYDTIADMSAAENIANGSICYTLGQSTYDDGKGAFYKVRTVTSGDVVDGVNIVALDVSNTIIAERISDKRMDDVEDAIDTIEDDINDIEDTIDLMNKRRFILIGDSFAVGIDGDNNIGPAVTGGGWANRFQTLMSSVADVYFNEEPLGGVYGFASSMPFLTVLQATGENIQHKDTITDIIVLGGTNDLSHTSDLDTAISNFMTYCKTTYPNAKVKIGCLGTDISNIVSLGNYYRLCEKYGAEYINDTKGLLCLKEYIGTDNTHLTASGYAYFQPFINQAILTGHTEFNFAKISDFTLTNATSDYGTIKVEERMTQNSYSVKYYRADNYQAPIFSYNNSNGDIDFVAGTYTNQIKLPNSTPTLGYGLRVRVHESNYLGGVVSNFKAYGLNGNLHIWSSTLITSSGSSASQPNRYLLEQQEIITHY